MPSTLRAPCTQQRRYGVHAAGRVSISSSGTVEIVTNGTPIAECRINPECLIQGSAAAMKADSLWSRCGPEVTAGGTSCKRVAARGPEAGEFPDAVIKTQRDGSDIRRRFVASGG